MKIYITIFTALLISGCTSINTTYESQGQTNTTNQSYEYAIIKGLHNVVDGSDAQLSIVTPSSTPVESVIIGHLLKNGISTVTSTEYAKLTKPQLLRCVVVEWGVSGRNSRSIPFFSSGYSQEVTVLIRDSQSNNIVYKGIGEHMGRTEEDDLRGALLAALKDYKQKAYLDTHHKKSNY